MLSRDGDQLCAKNVTVEGLTEDRNVLLAGTFMCDLLKVSMIANPPWGAALFVLRLGWDVSYAGGAFWLGHYAESASSAVRGVLDFKAITLPGFKYLAVYDVVQDVVYAATKADDYNRAIAHIENTGESTFCINNTGAILTWGAFV